jgi:hypothetical protein
MGLQTVTRTSRALNGPSYSHRDSLYTTVYNGAKMQHVGIRTFIMWLTYGPVDGSSKRGNKTSDFINDVEILDQLREYRLIRNNSVPK